MTSTNKWNSTYKNKYVKVSTSDGKKSIVVRATDTAPANKGIELTWRAYYVNLIYYKEKKIVNKAKKVTEFAWITSIEITKNNAKKLVSAGRNRWKIENQGFNRQKHWQGNIEHAYSWNERAQKNHYLMEQIADFMKQLYEHFFLEKNEIKKLQKNKIG